MSSGRIGGQLLGPIELLLRHVSFYLIGGNGSVGQDRDYIVSDLDKATVDVEALFGAIDCQPHLAVAKSANHWTVPRGDSESHHRRAATPRTRLWSRAMSLLESRQRRSVVPSYPATSAAIFLACSSACSITPTYMNACSGRWSHLPSHISSKLRNGIVQGRELAGLSGEHFRNVERLRQETFDAACSMHDQFVLFTQFINTQNGDDVLQFAIPLQSGLHAAGRWRSAFRRRTEDRERGWTKPAGRWPGRYPFPRSSVPGR